MTAEQPSLFERLGGVAAVRAVVDEFYKRLIQDERLAVFFQDTKLALLKQHQLAFLKIAFTEIPADLDVAEHLIEKHRVLFQNKGLQVEHFDMVVGHFVSTLTDVGVGKDLISEAAEIVLPLRPAFAAGAERYGMRQQSTEPEEKKEEVPELSPANSKNEKPKQTLNDKLGGVPAVKAAVEGLYKRSLADENLAHFFEHVNMTALKMHMIDFMKIAFTQIPEGFDVAGHMRTKHMTLFQRGLNETHFDGVTGHFVATLQELGVSAELIQEAVAVVGPLRPVFEQGAKDFGKKEEKIKSTAPATPQTCLKLVATPRFRVWSG